MTKYALRMMTFIVFTLSFIIGVGLPNATESLAENDKDWGPYYIYTTSMGSGSYHMAFAQQKAFMRTGSKLKAKAKPSQGMYDRLKHLEEEKKSGEAWRYFPIIAAADIKNLKEGRGQYEEYHSPNARFCFTYASSIYGFVTFDENIKTLDDLDGKSVAIGKRTQIAYGQQMAQLLEEIADSGAKLRWVGTGPALKGLQDGQYDVSITLIRTPLSKEGGEYVGGGENSAPDSALEEVMAGRKKLHAIDLTKEYINGLCKARNYGDGAFPVRIPKGTLGFFDRDSYWLSMPYGYYAYKDAPNHAVKEFVLRSIKEQDVIVDYYKPYAIMTPAMFTAGAQWDLLHEGAKEAFEELGWVELIKK